MVSAKRQFLKAADPGGNRHCRISMPFPKPVNIIPLEPYNTVGFLKGKASSEVKNLKQFPALHCFVYECASLSDLRFISSSTTVTPKIPPNQAPYQQTANLHVLGTYWTSIFNKEDDRTQMERCFKDMTTKLLAPQLHLELQIDPNFEIKDLAYAIPPGLTKEEVELTKETEKIGILYGNGRNCQNSGLFVYETDAMQLP